MFLNSMTGLPLPLIIATIILFVVAIISAKREMGS